LGEDDGGEAGDEGCAVAADGVGAGAVDAVPETFFGARLAAVFLPAPASTDFFGAAEADVSVAILLATVFLVTAFFTAVFLDTAFLVAAGRTGAFLVTIFLSSSAIVTHSSLGFGLVSCANFGDGGLQSP